LDATPLYPFGFGLSYAKFEYSDLELGAEEISAGGTVEVRVKVKNVGDRPGKETVQLYIEDPISNVSTPVKKLCGFTKVAIEPGETKTCTFQLGPEAMSLINVELQRVIEPGEFRVMVGASSGDIRQTGRFRVK